MIVHSTRNAGFLPQPNTIDVVASDILAPLALTTTAFMIPLMPNGDIVMAHNRRRGLEFPGGHIEPGESPTAAAVRETFEETGYRVSNIRAIGYQMMTSLGIAPPGYKYPHPLSFQQFFVGRVMDFDPYVENDECLNPQIISPYEAMRTLSLARIALLTQAIKRI